MAEPVVTQADMDRIAIQLAKMATDLMAQSVRVATSGEPGAGYLLTQSDRCSNAFAALVGLVSGDRRGA